MIFLTCNCLLFGKLTEVVNLTLYVRFCRATLCKRGLCRHACLSVRPSVSPSHSWIMSKRINISSNKFHHQVAAPFWFFGTKRYGNFPTGTPLTGANQMGRHKSRFWANSSLSIDDCWSANNNCDRPPYSLLHRRRRISKSMLITTSMEDHDEEKRTEFICTQR